MHGIGSMPPAGCGTQANATAGGMPVGARPNLAYGGAMPLGAPGPGFMTAAFAPAAVPTAERFINAQSGGVLLDQAGSPAGRIPEGSFVDAKEGKLYGADGKAIAVPQGGSFSFFGMPDIAALVNNYKGTEALHAATEQGTAKATMPMQMHQQPMTAVDGQWGPGGITAIKGGAAAKPGCDDHGGATKVGGASGSGMMPPGKVYGGGGVPALAAQMQQALTQAQQLAGGGMVAGVNGGGALDAMSATGRLGGMPGLQQALQELVTTLRQLTMALQPVEGGGGPAAKTPPAKVGDTPAKVDDKPATETSTTATATAGASGSGTSTSTSTDDSSGSTSTDGTTSASTSAGT